MARTIVKETNTDVLIKEIRNYIQKHVYGEVKIYAYTLQGNKTTEYFEVYIRPEHLDTPFKCYIFDKDQYDYPSPDELGVEILDVYQRYIMGQFIKKV